MDSSASNHSKNRTPKVAVIGAGLAGLTTAYRLHQQGIDVDLYEARPRVGGRVFTALISDKIIELGGHNFTDGGEAINLRRLVDECNLELAVDKLSVNTDYFDGEKQISVETLLEENRFDPTTLLLKMNELISKSKNMQEVMQGLFDKHHLLYKVLSVKLGAYEGASLSLLSSYYGNTLYYMLLGKLAETHAGENDN